MKYSYDEKDNYFNTAPWHHAIVLAYSALDNIKKQGFQLHLITEIPVFIILILLILLYLLRKDS